MAISVFDLFRIGIGPSSSHTVGPMRAARDFVMALPEAPVSRLVVRLHGSLAATGVGHGTDNAVVMGLMGEMPESIEPDSIAGRLAALDDGTLTLPNGHSLPFDRARDIEWDETCLAFHPNAMVITAYHERVIATNTYYSLGGGSMWTRPVPIRAGWMRTRRRCLIRSNRVTSYWHCARRMICVSAS